MPLIKNVLFFFRLIKIHFTLLFLLCILATCAFAQADLGFFQPSTTYNSSRVIGTAVTESVIGAAITVGLNYLWYKKFPHSKFHYFNDDKEWLQMDKVGHATTAYNIAAIQGDVLHWGGVKQGTASLIGALTGLGFMTMIEIMDGHSAEWGFSKGDMLANISGTLLYEGQQLLWGQQRISLKYSFHKSIFAKYNPGELGSTFVQQSIKDYNGQSYWLSVNIASFLPSNTNFPRWMNIAAGYGADGMTGAMKNPTEVNGKPIPSFKRYRQFYLSMDADLYRINDISPFATTLLKVNRTVKMIAPALEWNNVDKLKFHWLYN